jgi:uncharacterized lipoprotein YddW (UPF0748 family)
MSTTTNCGSERFYRSQSAFGSPSLAANHQIGLLVDKLRHAPAGQWVVVHNQNFATRFRRGISHTAMLFDRLFASELFVYLFQVTYLCFLNGAALILLDVPPKAILARCMAGLCSADLGSTSNRALRWTAIFFLVCLAGLGRLEAQEFRAAWADVFHVGMGSQTEVNTMVSSLVAGRYNALIVQVLGFMDTNGTASHGAHWKSSKVPWSPRVTASFDPLAYLCTQAHANGIQVHAWLGGSGGGPYRVSTVWPPAGNTNLTPHPEWFMVPQTNSEKNAISPVDGNYVLDMGSPDAQDYIVSIVRELVTNYEIDGINWDDEINGTGYAQGYAFPAYAQTNYARSGLARYRNNTGYVGTPSATDSAYGNYRRRFKNELMARCQAEIQSIKTNPRQPLRHTSAPLAYGTAPGTCDFTPSTPYLYYCDWAGMLQNGWIDAAIPQVYRAETNNAANFRGWCDRTFSCWRYSRHIYIGLELILIPSPIRLPNSSTSIPARPAELA